MSFRSIVRDVRDGFGSLSRRSFEVRLPGHHRAKSHSSVHELEDQLPVVQNSQWASLPPELLRDVIKRLEASESTWPARKHVVACASVCKSWREMCKEIVSSLESSGKITFPVSLKQALRCLFMSARVQTLVMLTWEGKTGYRTQHSLHLLIISNMVDFVLQPGARDGTIQCFIKRDKSKMTYHLFLCLSPALLVENGKFLLSAKRTRRTTCTEYIISMDADNISRYSSVYIGKLRSNFLGTKFIICDTQSPYNNAQLSPPGRSRRFNSKKVSPKVPSGSYNIGQVAYELNVLGTSGPRKVHCTMYSIPTSAVEPGGTVPGQPELLSRPLEDSFRSISLSKSITDNSTEFGSARFLDIFEAGSVDGEGKDNRPLILKNKSPRWHEQLQCWCLNFKGRVTVASVKNFQLIADTQPAAGAPAPSQPAQSSDFDKVILQFGKVGKDMFTMDYRYPLSAFQAFAICLTSFDTKLACE